VYVLCRLVAGMNEPIGTACVVGYNLLLTARSCIYVSRDDDTSHESEIRNLSITKSVQGNDDGSYHHDGGLINVVKYESFGDICLLRCIGSDEFSEHTFLPLCPANDLPNLDDEPRAKLYSCPTQAFAENKFNICSCESSDFTKISSMSTSVIMMRHVSASGSGGGALVDIQGRLIGIITHGRRTRLENINFDVDDKVSILSSLDSCRDSYNTYTMCSIPCMCDGLLDCLEELCSV
jgi:hypothetical protein